MSRAAALAGADNGIYFEALDDAQKESRDSNAKENPKKRIFLARILREVSHWISQAMAKSKMLFLMIKFHLIAPNRLMIHFLEKYGFFGVLASLLLFFYFLGLFYNISMKWLLGRMSHLIFVEYAVVILG